MTTTDEEQQPDALLEQARAIVRKIRPGPLWEQLDARMPIVPGYMCRYDDLKREFAIAVAREVLAQLSPNVASAACKHEITVGVKEDGGKTLFRCIGCGAARDAGQVDPRSALPSRTLEQHLADSEGGHHD